MVIPDTDLADSELLPFILQTTGSMMCVPMYALLCLRSEGFEHELIRLRWRHKRY